MTQNIILTQSLVQQEIRECDNVYPSDNHTISQPQNSACGIVTHRRDTTLICSCLREVWGECGEAGKGKVTYRRYAPVLNLIRLSVQYDFVLCTLRFSLVLNPVCAPSIY